MKPKILPPLVIAVFGLLACSTAGCAEKEKMAVTSATAREPAPLARLSEPAAPVPLAATASPGAADVQWDDIKEYTFEMRDPFFAGLKRLEAKVDDQIRELIAKRATMKGTTTTREWDFAMKEMESARSYLKSVGAELSKASRDTWGQEKDKVGRAWVSTQEAYGKVKSSTTS